MITNLPDLESVVKSTNAFALSLYRVLKSATGNLFFSPYSISTALAMTFAGSRGNTEKQMAETLCFNLDQEQLHKAFFDLQTQIYAIQSAGDVKLHIANSIWPQIDCSFLAEYLALLQECYGVLVIGVDYRQTETARATINAWVSEKTEKKIPELLAQGILTSLTTLVLTNAIYFKGDWLSQFDKDETKKAKFWTSSTDNVPVNMMAQEGEFGYSELENLQILELPYKGGDISFIVLLPKTIDGLPEIEEALSEKTLGQWISNLWKERVRVFLPKFTLESEFELSKRLKSMGMTDAFDSRANFSGMNGVGGLSISQVIHKAFIDVGEEGTEAAAATAVIMSRGVSFPVEFCADHPFLFLIREKKTGSILFFGRIAAPNVVKNM